MPDESERGAALEAGLIDRDPSVSAPSASSRTRLP